MTTYSEKLNRIARKIGVIRDHLDSESGCSVCVDTEAYLEWSLGLVELLRAGCEGYWVNPSEVTDLLSAALGLEEE